MGWWVISDEKLMALLRRAYEGEDPFLLFLEEYANSEPKWPEDKAEDSAEPR